eukprot:g10156.t1
MTVAVFAVAYAVSLIFGRDPTTATYPTCSAVMRRNFLKCLLNKRFTLLKMLNRPRNREEVYLATARRAVHSSWTLWLVEAEDGISGFPLRFMETFRLKNLATGHYISQDPATRSWRMVPTADLTTLLIVQASSVENIDRAMLLRKGYR